MITLRILGRLVLAQVVLVALLAPGPLLEPGPVSAAEAPPPAAEVPPPAGEAPPTAWEVPPPAWEIAAQGGWVVNLPPSPVDDAPVVPGEPVKQPLLDMKVLVILDTGTYGQAEPLYGATNAMITGALDTLGIPYDVIDVAVRAPGVEPVGPELFDAEDLATGRHGRYYAIFVATSVAWSPWKDGDGNTLASGLNQAERDLIRDYEARFGVRRVTWYAYPNAEDYGLEPVPVGSDVLTATLPFTATFTTAGPLIFDYLRTEAGIPFVEPGVLGYPADVAAGKRVTPVLRYHDGKILRTLLAIYRPDNAGEHMVLTIGGHCPPVAPTRLFSRLLPYGMITWATRGHFIGERHLYFAAQPDGILATGDVYDFTAHAPIDCDAGGCGGPGQPAPYRNTPDDLQNVADWLHDFRTGTPNAAGLILELPLNGEGSLPDRTSGGDVLPGTLTAKAAELEASFAWLNHTYSGADLDTATADLVRTEILSNTEVAALLGLSDYLPSALLTADSTGINNATFIATAYGLGIRDLLVDASVPDEDLVGEVVPSYRNPSPNTGIPYPGYPDLLLIPRNAGGLYPFATTPEELTDYTNVLSPECPDYPDTTSTPCFDYDQVLDRLTDQALDALLDFSINPTMFSMNHLHDYGGGKTLLTDFITALYAKVNRYTADDVPIVSLRTHEIGERMRQRAAFDASGVQATITHDGAITITTQSAARIPLTGVGYGTATETYGGQIISYFEMGDHDTLVIPAARHTPMPPTDLTVDPVAGDVALAWQAPVSYTDGSPLTTELTYRIYRSTKRTFPLTQATLLDEIVDTTYTDAGAAEEGYSYAITAVCAHCWVLESEPVFWVAAGVPSAPGELAGTAAGSDLLLSWLPVTTYREGDALWGAVVYRLYEGPSPDFTPAQGTLLVETGALNYRYAGAAAEPGAYAVVAVGAGDPWELVSEATHWTYTPSQEEEPLIMYLPVVMQVHSATVQGRGLGR